MKKSFKYYAVAWAVLFAVYNAIVFTVQPILGFEKNYDARFWISWAFVALAFVGQLACALVAFSAKKKDKLFLNIPLITESYAAAVVMTVAGSVCMLIPDLPAWVASVVVLLVFMFSAISVVKAKAAADAVSSVSEKVKANTFFIKALAADAETLVARGKTEEIKAELKKVYDAIRYSDPMSNNALASAENGITIAFSKLTAAVADNDANAVKRCAEEVLILVKDRNNKCRLLK